MIEENQLEIFHQDGNIAFGLTKGGYSIENNILSVSIEAERLDDGEFPSCAYFCIFDFHISGELKVGKSFHYKRVANDFGEYIDLHEQQNQPKAHAYFGFHVTHLECTWTILEIDGEKVVFSLEAIHDDTDYYDKRAKPKPTRGLFRLSPSPISALWIP